MARIHSPGDIAACRALAVLGLLALDTAGSEDGTLPPETVRDSTRSIWGASYHPFSGAARLPRTKTSAALAAILIPFWKDTHDSVV